SAQAYGKANALMQPGSADLLANQAEALALANERNLQGQPVQLLEAALKLDPSHVKSLWYAGIAALQRDDKDGAKKYWTMLAVQPELPDDLRTALDEQLQQLGVSAPRPAPAPAAPAPPVSGGLALSVQVELAPNLAAQSREAQTLFVFAKAESGPPMPLAVQRITAPKLPLTLTLDDSMAMMPSLKLSQFDHWIVTARLTRGGTVQPESGDLQGQLTVQKADAGKPVRIVIDQVLP
ncbi:MAG TPA: c-type cytochrome biogenesis protein CcmI, partial [Nevskiaceae bacterium]|nr:c-type cytochrome biogenesis protein CcmI [Nevskiaceae bacterium]